MQEMISNQIQNYISLMIFNLAIAIVPTIIIILLCTLHKPRSYIIRNNFYVFIIGATILATLITTPIMGMTINLLRDYNNPVLLTKEGIVEDKTYRAKLQVIGIDNEQYVLSPDIEAVKKGEYCVMEYFKYSKYVFDLYIKEDVKNEE